MSALDEALIELQKHTEWLNIYVTKVAWKVGDPTDVPLDYDNPRGRKAAKFRCSVCMEPWEGNTQ